MSGSRQFTVYGFYGCQYCKKAIELLYQLGETFTYVDTGKTKEARTKWMDENKPKERTFPRIWISNDRVAGHTELGGYTQLEDWAVTNGA